MAATQPMSIAAATKAQRFSPEYSAGWVSRLLFLWPNALFKTANSKQLQLQDLFRVSRDDDVAVVSARFEALLRKHTSSGAPKVVQGALVEQFKPQMMWAGGIKLLNSTLQFAPPLLLYGLLSEIADQSSGAPSSGVWAGYVFAVALCVAIILRVITENQYFQRTVRSGFQVRTVLTTAIYRKSLRMSPTARQDTPVGKIVNLMQLDAARLEAFTTQAWVLIDSWYQIIGYMILLGIFVGPSALAGLATMLFLIPFQMVVMKAMGKRRGVIARATDQRIKVTNEALQGIRTLKQYNWEEAYRSILFGSRDRELAAIWNLSIVGSINSTLMQVAPLVVGAVTLLVYSASGGSFTAARIFSALSVLNQLRFPLMFLPGVMQQLADAKVALGRLDKFMAQPEVERAGRTLGEGSGVAGASGSAGAVNAGHSGSVGVGGVSAAASAEDGGAPSPTSAAVHRLGLASPLPAASTTTGSAAAVAAGDASSSAEQAGAALRLSNVTFYHENPLDRTRRLAEAAEEAKRAAAAAAKRGGKGKPQQPGATPGSAAAGSAPSGGKAASSTPAAASAGPTPAGATPAGATPAGAAGAAPSAAQESSVPPILRDVSLSVPRGALYAVIGEVGSGKSSLLAGILGEMHRAQGSVAVAGRVAYVAQQAWVLNATLRKNITFAGDAFRLRAAAAAAAAAASRTVDAGVSMQVQQQQGAPAASTPSSALVPVAVTVAGEATAAEEEDAVTDHDRYQRVLDVCQLGPDLRALPFGDATEIGEKGVTLSGGQKQRTSLARAAYSDADIILLDDPLSALDAEVGKAVFFDCISGLLAGKTRLLVTNQLHFLPHCDGVVVLAKDEATGSSVVRSVGTFAQLMDTDLSFRTLMTAYGHGAGGGSGGEDGSNSVSTPSAERAAASRRAKRSEAGAASELGAAAAAGNEAASSSSEAQAGGAPPTPTTTNTASTAAAGSAGSGSGEADKTAVAIPVAAATGGTAKAALAPVDGSSAPAGASAKVGAVNALPPSKAELMSAEEKNEGAVQFRYYVRYFRAAGFIWTTVIVLLCAYSASQFAQLLSQWWLAVWSSDTSYAAHKPGFYQGIYVAIGFGAALFAFLRVVTMSLMGIRASRKLHADLLTTILRAPLSFFDTTPLGRVLVRFSKDTDAIDNALVMNMGMLGMCIFFVAGSLAAIVFATPWFAIAIVPILVIYVYVNNYFRNAARETKRFDSITRSPIFAHFSESLNGMTTIRAYGLVERFAAENELRVSANINAWYSLRSCDRWLSVRLESLGAFIILVAALLAVGTARSTSGSTGQSAAGLSGFSLSYAIAVTGLFTWLLRTFAETEQQLNSVERVAYYTDSVPQEPYEQPPQHAAPPAGWPSAGAIEMAGYRMRYRDNTPEVLHGVTVSIKGGMRVGIVGRTGAGKSSMTQALFRLVTDDCHSGRIAIDGVDIDTVGLSRLRSNMAIIPQDPVMFSGTIRTNLDPTGSLAAQADKGNAALWAALESVGLDGKIRSLKGELDAPVAEFGENLSQGERQLLCLSRVLLRRCRVIMMDEASSSLDHDSDMRIQAAIRRAFTGSTMLIIAHRLNTIITCDAILVMDAGVVAEFGHPHELLTRGALGGAAGSVSGSSTGSLSGRPSIFASLVDETGAESAAALRRAAAEAYALTHGGSTPIALAAAAAAAAGGGAVSPSSAAAESVLSAASAAGGPRLSISVSPEEQTHSVGPNVIASPASISASVHAHVPPPHVHLSELPALGVPTHTHAEGQASRAEASSAAAAAVGAAQLAIGVGSTAGDVEAALEEGEQVAAIDAAEEASEAAADAAAAVAAAGHSVSASDAGPDGEAGGAISVAQVQPTVE